MGNDQNCDSYINISSSPTYRPNRGNKILTYIAEKLQVEIFKLSRFKLHVKNGQSYDPLHTHTPDEVNEFFQFT
jgi:hypothetical protein